VLIEVGARIIAVFGFALGAAVVLPGLLFVMTGKRLHQRLFNEPKPRASALAIICCGICGCVIAGTIVTGWTTSHPEMTLAIVGPAWLFAFVSYLILFRKTREAGCQSARDRSVR
jgi:hypothetical protein